MTRLIVKREGSLLPVIIDLEITDTQLAAVQAVLEDGMLAEHVNDTVMVRNAYRDEIALTLEEVNREIDLVAHPDSEWARERREGLR